MRPADNPLIAKEELQSRVYELAREVSADFTGTAPILLVVLKGSLYFAADLARAMSIPVIVDFIRVESYGAGASSGSIEFTALPKEPLTGRAVFIVEDVLDTGLTATHLLRWVRSRGPESARLIALLDKPAARKWPIEADYTGFQIANDFVVGYGLDYEQRFRELPAIYRLTDG